MPVKWDDESEKKLLMAILHLMGPQAPTPNYNQVAALMGSEYTGDGIRQKYTKQLKKQMVNQFGEVEIDGAKTPVKKVGKKANGEGGTKSAGSKRKAKKDISEDGDDEEVKTPSKKLKTEESEGDEV